MDSNKNNRNTFWLSDPKILINRKQILDIIPTNDMTKAEKQNAITRFCFYGAGLLYLNKSNETLMYLLIFVIVTLILLNLDSTNKNKKKKRTNKSLGKIMEDEADFAIEGFKNSRKPKTIQLVDRIEGFNGFQGEVNSDGNIIEKETKSELVSDEDHNYRGKCQPPSKHNPFGNVLLTDYVDNPTRLPACSLADKKIEKTAEEYFNENLFKDVDEVYGSVNSQRQFISNPSTTIPNPQKEFAEWLYKMPPTCKEGDNCYKYEDLRQFRNSGL